MHRFVGSSKFFCHNHDNVYSPHVYHCVKYCSLTVESGRILYNVYLQVTSRPSLWGPRDGSLRPLRYGSRSPSALTTATGTRSTWRAATRRVVTIVTRINTATVLGRGRSRATPRPAPAVAPRGRLVALIRHRVVGIYLLVSGRSPVVTHSARRPSHPSRAHRPSRQFRARRPLRPAASTTAPWAPPGSIRCTTVHPGGSPASRYLSL